VGSRFAYLYRVNHSLWSLKCHSDNVVIFVHVDLSEKRECPKEAWFAWGKQQPRFYRSCISTVIKHVKQLTPLAHEWKSI